MNSPMRGQVKLSIRIACGHAYEYAANTHPHQGSYLEKLQAYRLAGGIREFRAVQRTTAELTHQYIRHGGEP